MSLTPLTLLCKKVFMRNEMSVWLTHACLMISSYLMAVGCVSYCDNAGMKQIPPRLLLCRVNENMVDSPYIW